MEFMCPKCKQVFRPHRFIGLRHPRQAKCPDCDVRGTITVRGTKIRKSIFHECNKANAEAEKKFGKGGTR